MVVKTTSTGITVKNLVIMWSEFNFLDESIETIMEKLEGPNLHLTQIFNGLKEGGFSGLELEDQMFLIMEAMWAELKPPAQVSVKSREPKIDMNYFSPQIVIFHIRKKFFSAEMHELANLLLENGVKAIIIEEEKKQSKQFFLAPDIAGDSFLERSEFYKEKNLFYLKKEIPSEILVEALEGIIEFE